MGKAPKMGARDFSRSHFLRGVGERLSLLGNPLADWGNAPANDYAIGKAFALFLGL